MAMQWLRLKTAVDCPLRRGAWYPVASLTRLEAVVTLQGKPVSVPRPFVEIRKTPPHEWTVLRNPAVEPRVPTTFRQGYLVCPGCQNRVVLPATQVPEQICPRCSHTYPIAWGEKYLEKG